MSDSLRTSANGSEIAEATVQNANKVTCRVSRVEATSSEIRRVWLELADPAFAWRPGQYIDLIREDGARRSFSIANRCSYDGIVELHVRLQGTGRFVDSVLDSVIARAVLWIEGPFGDFRFHRNSQCDRTEAIFVAGGTGFGPFKAIIEELVAVGERRPLHLYWGGRSADDLYLEQWLFEQGDALPQLRYVPVLSDVQPGQVNETRTGLVHRAVMDDFPDLRKCDVYVCGPPELVQAARTDLADLCGLPSSQFFC
ncbi:NAD(P)H-flavin reductase [Burkholderia ambifaria]|uniref:NAD(P)H-flavin reductase n=1 Tax=Burkholderia ambifaria TaxID=152480 RepID=UPI00158E9D51|nr:NAD(P)H-flavin reductase [Burkholderia ambifaria]